MNPRLVALLNLPWQTLYDDSMLLLTRLQLRRRQVGDLQSSLSEAGAKQADSEQSSARLELLLSGAGTQLGELQTGLMGISSSLGGLRMAFDGLSSSLVGYFQEMQGQNRELRRDRDVARFQLSAWRIVALVEGGVSVAVITALVVLLVK